MGCACTRLKVLYEEDLILKQETAIGFQNHRSSSIDMIIRKYSFQGTLNFNFLIEIAKELKLHIDDYDKHQGITEFFNELNNSSKQFYTQLLVLGIMNGKSSDPTKAYLLFQVFDAECQYSLSYNQAKELLHMIFAMSIEKAYYLISAMLKTSSDVRNLKSYIKRCKIASSYCEEEAVKSFLVNGKSIKMNDFVDKLLGFKGGYLLQPTTVRLYAYEFYAKNKPQRTIALTKGITNIKNKTKPENRNKMSLSGRSRDSKTRKSTSQTTLPDVFNLDIEFKPEVPEEIESDTSPVTDIPQPPMIAKRRSTTVMRKVSIGETI